MSKLVKLSPLLKLIVHVTAIGGFGLFFAMSSHRQTLVDDYENSVESSRVLIDSETLSFPTAETVSVGTPLPSNLGELDISLECHNDSLREETGAVDE
ncbi:MAG: G5 domain-containing protein [Clostridiales bacterium]|jgi:hypothetical protein|nr:G5 domain-containing protein [Clostridiales bacterium]